MNIRPDYAKRKCLCHYCKGEITRGQEIIRIAHRLKNPLFWRKKVSHLGCFVEHLHEYFNTHRFTPAPRPRRAVVRVEDKAVYKRLQANIRYHRHVGNAERLAELESKAAEMRSAFGKILVRDDST